MATNYHTRLLASAAPPILDPEERVWIARTVEMMAAVIEREAYASHQERTEVEPWSGCTKQAQAAAVRAVH